MTSKKWIRAKKIAVLVAAIGGTTLGPHMAYGQVSTATIKGKITLNGAPAKEATQIIATNKATGSSYRATSDASGGYTLSGVEPGSYEIRVTGSGADQKTEVVTLHVGETAVLDLTLGSGGTERISIVGSIQRAAVKTPEVATIVTQEQIENLPQVTRNFMSFADLAPGVRFNVDSGGYTKMQSGAQSPDFVNVFIDGVSQKNYVLKGGVSGQDTSRGNPFPQSAIAEYKVISQNYKAEFDQLSSAAISAVTKSGTNEVHGDVFLDHTSGNWTALDPFQRQKSAQGIDRPNFKQDQFGFSVGGPIVLDKMHYFMAYEGKDNTDPRQVTLHNTTGMSPIPAALQAMTGNADDKFKENLLFGKIDMQLSEDQHLAISAKIRREKDTVPENADFGAVNLTKDRTNDETRLDVKHELTRDNWINEARIAYESSEWKPQTNCTNQPLIEYKTTSWADIIWGGCSPDSQDKKQSGVLLEDNFTLTALSNHTLKTGAKLKDLNLFLAGTPSAVDHAYVFYDSTGNVTLNGQPATPFYAPWLSQTTPLREASYTDHQFGIYAQDDWQVNQNLELNLGARWDYEDNMLDNKYVTPAGIVADLNAPDVARNGITPAAGQTYAQSLAKGGININDYISNGSSRKPFTGALAPRLGFSYDINADRDSVIFGGWGRAYDRTMAQNALDELFHNQGSSGEIWLINNNLKMPFSDQFTLGLRQKLAQWNGEIGYTNTQGYNGFVWRGGNRNPDGSNGNSPIDPVWGGAPVGHTGNLLLGDFVTRTKTETVFVKADKPYTKISGWGATVAYTYSNAKTNATTWSSDIISWAYGKAAGSDLHATTEVEKHRVVATGMMELPYEFMLSGKYTFGSGKPVQLYNCSAGPCTFEEGKLPANKQLDLGLSKDFGLPNKTKLVVRLDVLNVFNTPNYDSVDVYPWDSNYKQFTGVGGNPMRTVKLGARYVF